MELFPLWRVAKETGRTVQELHEMCDAERIVGCEWRMTPSGGVWWSPLHPIIDDGSEPLAPASDDTVPLWAIAKRDNIKLDALQRMCNKGQVDGAVKVGGCWYIPQSTVVAPPRRGRPRPQLPDWLEPEDSNSPLG